MTTLPAIPHASDVEKAIVGRLVTDLLAAGLSVTIWNGGEASELDNCTDPAKIFAELCASDEDELTLEDANGYAGWIRLVWGNDECVISDYSTRLESVMAAANQIAEELTDGYVPELPSYEDALCDSGLARVLFDASKGGNVRGITENHRFELADVIRHGVPNRYQCLGGGAWGPEHHVEPKYAGTMNNVMWIVPGTYRDDPAFDQAGAMEAYARSHRTHYWLAQYPTNEAEG